MQGAQCRSERADGLFTKPSIFLFLLWNTKALSSVPSEADSLILQASLGCSHNRCTFCPTYKGRRFRIKDLEAIKAEIDEAAAYGLSGRFSWPTATP